MTSFAFSCVLDSAPPLLAQAFVWVNCLKRLRGVPGDDIFVHLVDVDDNEFLSWLQAEEVNVVQVERFDRRSPHCNKISQLNTFLGTYYDQIVLMDCDTAWIGDAPLPSGSPVSGCVVDAALPSEGVLQKIFSAAGLGDPEWTPVRFPMGGGCEFTDANNLNGGLYICDKEFVADLARAWEFWARWCLDELALFETFAIHVDQVSFALAMRELGATAERLPIEWNYPTHFPAEMLPDISPQILHYHRQTDGRGRLAPVGRSNVDRAIDALNLRIGEFIEECQPSPTFLNVARQVGPNFGGRIRDAGLAKLGKVVVGTGWWCDDEPHRWAIGSRATRSVAFFDLWYRQVVRCLRPHRIAVTDSAAPLKPDHSSFPLVQWIELDANYGQPNDLRAGLIKTKYSGFTRSVINGAMYALCCDADFYVYVEQDCLVYGAEFLRAALGDTSGDILLGAPTVNGKGLAGAAAAPMLQQSLIIVRRPGLERFLQGLLGAPWTDGERSPEEIMRLQLAPYDFVQVPYGRSRPIDFYRRHFYAQHLDDHELNCFRAVIENSAPRS